MLERTRSLLIGACLSVGFAIVAPACESDEFGIELSAQSVVLTPGGTAAVRLDIARPDWLASPVQLDLLGVPDDVAVTLSETQTTEDHVMLTLTAQEDAPAQSVSFTIKARVGPHVELEPMGISVQIPTAPATGLEEYAPGVDGVVEALVMDGQEITFEVIDGVAVAHGDIVLGDAQLLRETYGTEAALAQSGGPQFRSATCNFGFNTEFTCSRWDDGVIGYTFANNWGSEAENLRMRTIIESAMDHWEQNTGIRFVQRSFGQYLEFRDGGGCSSNVGRSVITGFDSQSISLNNDGCDSMGTAVHEIGHAVGLYHEQSRDDRDGSVVVDFGRVRDGKLHNFFQWGEYEQDIGPYDYGSIMHYPRWAFARNRSECQDSGVLAECTVRPNVVTATIGQRAGLSEGDILGAYTLYPPEFEIEGAAPAETNDRFFLLLDYETPTPAASRLSWTTDRAPGVLGTGHSLNLLASDVPSGLNVITASFIAGGVTVVAQSITLNVVNDAPEVTLATTNGLSEQQLGSPFNVSATITDTEDGSCPSPLCDYTWSPTPSSGSPNSATRSFVLDTVGTHTITLDVEDAAGAVGTGTVTVDVVNSDPTAQIVQPGGNLSVSDGATLGLEGIGFDVNETAGVLPCSALDWASSNPADTFAPSAVGCEPNVTFNGNGVRTISLNATDSEGASATDSVTVTVSGCGGGNCLPSATLGLPDPHSGTAYFIEQNIDLVLSISDAESGNLGYEVISRRAGEADFTHRDGNFSGPAGIVYNLERTILLEDGISPWPFCSNSAQYRDYELILTVDDGDGGVTSDSVTIEVGCEII